MMSNQMVCQPIARTGSQRTSRQPSSDSHSLQGVTVRDRLGHCPQNPLDNVSGPPVFASDGPRRSSYLVKTVPRT